MEDVKIEAVAKRDDWTCHICRRPVTTATWSLDHLVPVAAGGLHTYENVAIAHHLCNAIRGDLPLRDVRAALDAVRLACEAEGL